jgi:hypothetical protein
MHMVMTKEHEAERVSRADAGCQRSGVALGAGFTSLAAGFHRQ